MFPAQRILAEATPIGPNHLGYGFLASSEAAAVHDFQFSCEDTDLRADVVEACGDHRVRWKRDQAELVPSRP